MNNTIAAVIKTGNTIAVPVTIDLRRWPRGLNLGVSVGSVS